MEFYRDVMRVFWTNLKNNIDSEQYYKENELGVFNEVRNELLTEVFQSNLGELTSNFFQEGTLSVQSISLENASCEQTLTPSNPINTECVKYLRKAYLTISNLSVLKEKSFKENLAILSYSILFEDMSLKIVYDLLKQRMKYRLLEFSKEERVYGTLYPRIKKQEIYVILGMLVKSNDKYLMKFMLKELVECLEYDINKNTSPKTSILTSFKKTLEETNLNEY
ncbi:MAG: hypothetical protein O7C59_09775 [Rickettsia endosymbiont of Ixodes persulcatus]|nr:hypothetical protein [Rickettsia endosymbiont of Ixodes persulcatus]